MKGTPPLPDIWHSELLFKGLYAVLFTPHTSHELVFFYENSMNTASRKESAREQDATGVEQEKVVIVIFMFSSVIT